MQNGEITNDKGSKMAQKKTSNLRLVKPPDNVKEIKKKDQEDPQEKGRADSLHSDSGDPGSMRDMASYEE